MNDYAAMPSEDREVGALSLPPIRWRRNSQNIGSGTGGSLEYEKFKQFLLNSIV